MSRLGYALIGMAALLAVAGDAYAQSRQFALLAPQLTQGCVRASGPATSVPACLKSRIQLAVQCTTGLTCESPRRCCTNSLGQKYCSGPDGIC
jgi:hypothetical protein